MPRENSVAGLYLALKSPRRTLTQIMSFYSKVLNQSSLDGPVGKSRNPLKVYAKAFVFVCMFIFGYKGLQSASVP